MVRIYPKHPSETIKMLHARNVEPFKILNKLNCNTYVTDLLRNYGISCTFNISDLVNYKDFDCSSLIDKPSPESFSESLSLSPLSNTHLITIERVDKILENEMITTKSGGAHGYLIRSKEKVQTIDSMLDQGDLQRVDGSPTLSNLLELSLLSLGENDADIQS